MIRLWRIKEWWRLRKRRIYKAEEKRKHDVDGVHMGYNTPIFSGDSVIGHRHHCNYCGLKTDTYIDGKVVKYVV